ncbi:hypothetical protein [Streptomyces sp. x-19]|uniref:hypothetical protein n=1 Tax=Streptomyces sp. x-19 TaxID=2789280 RepID=UPI003980760D
MATSQPSTEQVRELGRAVDDFVRGETAWAGCDRAKRRELLHQIHAATTQHAAAWVHAAVAHKKLPKDSPPVGEEWITGPYPVQTSLGALAASVEALEESRSPVDGFSFGRAPGGRVSVRVLPHSIWDQLLLNGFSAELRMPPGVTKETVRSRAGLALLRPAETKGVGVVLGAGNITSTPILDVVYELHATNRVVAYDCVASLAVVISSAWAQKDRLPAHLRAALSDPGPALDGAYFAPVLAVLELPGSPHQFLDDAVRTANETFTGTPGANLIAHPRTVAPLGPAPDDAIAALRYGTVALNAWPGVGYLTATATWGAYPGHTLDDVQSGIGVGHNALLLDGPERTVVRGPFRPASRAILHGEPVMPPRPPWFVTNRTADTTGRLLADFAAAPRRSALPRVFASALRG